MIISTGLEFRQTLKAGPYAWPGGYPLILVCDDGGVLCFDCGKSEGRQIIDAIRTRTNNGWRVSACVIHWEGPDETCNHCGKVIPSAYGGDDA